jgi:hypothetical protein
MKLSDFINNNYMIEDNNKLTNSNLLKLYNNIKKPNDIIWWLRQGKGELEDSAGYQLKQLFNKVKNINNHINVFCFNGDVNMPPYEHEYRIKLFTTPYNKELQEIENNVPFKNKLDYTVYDEIPKNITLFMNQVYTYHPQVHFIPLTIQLFGGTHCGQNYNHINIDLLELKNKYTLNDKTILCYLNIGTGSGGIRHHITNELMLNNASGNHRQLCYDSVSDNKRPFICVEKIDTIIGNNLRDKFINYYEKLCKSKFCLCPGIISPDTYRIWDCLYMGCIPIVLKYDDNNDAFRDLPILFIDNYEEFITLTEDQLNNIWNEMTIKSFNYDKLHMSFWGKYISNNMG